MGENIWKWKMDRLFSKTIKQLMQLNIKEKTLYRSFKELDMTE